MEAVVANGTTSPQSPAASASGPPAVKRRFEECAAFDKRLRISVRQTKSAYRYRDIVVRKQDGFTHILLSTKSSENNSLNPDVSVLEVLASEGGGGRPSQSDSAVWVDAAVIIPLYCVFYLEAISTVFHLQ